MKSPVAVVVSIAVILLLSACQAVTSDVNVSLRGVAITVTLSEEEMNAEIAAHSAARAAENPDATPFVQGASVDFAPGSITVTGEFRAPNEGTLQGSVQFGVALQDGRVNVSVISVNITGYDANDQMITDMTIMIEQILTNRAGRAAETTDGAEATAEVTEEATEEASAAETSTNTPEPPTPVTIESVTITDSEIQMVIRITTR